MLNININRALINSAHFINFNPVNLNRFTINLTDKVKSFNPHLQGAHTKLESLDKAHSLTHVKPPTINPVINTYNTITIVLLQIAVKQLRRILVFQTLESEACRQVRWTITKI